MRLESRHHDVQPVGHRQRREQTVELRCALGAVETYRCRSVSKQGAFPESHQMSFVDQFGRSRGLGPLSPLDFGRRRSGRDLELELNEELHIFRWEMAAVERRLAARVSADPLHRETCSSRFDRGATDSDVTCPFTK
jgi:hypothetical protein